MEEPLDVLEVQVVEFIERYLSIQKGRVASLRASRFRTTFRSTRGFTGGRRRFNIIWSIALSHPSIKDASGRVWRLEKVERRARNTLLFYRLVTSEATSSRTAFHRNRKSVRERSTDREILTETLR